MRRSRRRGVPGALRHRIYFKDIGSDVGDAAKAAYTNCVLIASKRDTKSHPLRVALASPARFERAAFRLGVRPEVAFLVINKFKYRQNYWFFSRSAVHFCSSLNS